MGKKSRILYATVLLVNLTIFILDLSPIPFPFFKISFAVTLSLLGLLLIVRGITYKLDSSMLLGIMFLSFGVLNGTSYFTKQYYELWPYYFYTTALSCLITGLVFRNNVEIKFAILLLGFGALTHIFSFSFIKLWLYIVLMIVWFIGYFVVNLIISRRRPNG